MQLILKLTVLALLFLTGCADKSSPPSQPPIASQPTTVAAKSDRDPARFADEIVAFEKYDRKNTPPRDPVLFIGSSSMVRWDSALAFPNLTIVNRGFGGSTPADVNYYFDRIVTPYHPRLIVLFTSDNGIMLGDTPQQTLAAFREFVEKARKIASAAPIVYISIKPSPSRMNVWSQAAEANRLIAEECKRLGPTMRYVDIVPAMMDAKGQPRDELFVADKLHMNQAGYDIWNQALAPVFKELLH